MEFEEDWEYLSHNNLSNSQTIEKDSSLAAKIVEDHGDVQVKEISEITEECDAVPQTQVETKEVEFEEEEVLKEENAELGVSTNLEFEEVEVEEVEEVKEVAGVEPNGFNQRILRLSSVGIAAATLTMFIFGASKRNQNRELQIQICADDKGMKQVDQQATKINKALSGVRGSTATTANVSFGGYYQGL